MPARPNLVLIGMPGVGKSTIGVLLAKAASRDFLDTDVAIQAREGRALQDIIDTDGVDAFLAVEEHLILTLDATGHVIATGGSVVYSRPAMKHLAAGGVIIHLHLPPVPLERRLADLKTRGVVMSPGKTIADLFKERHPLYEKHAQVTIDCTAKTHEQIVAEIMRNTSVNLR